MGNFNFKEDFEKVSDADLLNYVENRQKYIPEAVAAAIDELQKRGHVFSDEELNAITNELATEINVEEPKNNENSNWVKPGFATTADSNSPEYYSQRVISVFSILFSTFFGSILMAMNLYRAGSKKGIAEVLLFGFAFTLLIVWFATKFGGQNNSFGFIFNLIGGAILNTYFWNKFIGKETTYRTRSWWQPLVIGVGICLVLLYGILNGVR